MKSVNGLVKPLNPDVEVNYEGHTLVVSYRLSGELNDFFSIPERATIELTKDGNFVFEIPNEEDITGKILVSVKGPISEIFSQEYDYSELNATVLSGTKTKNKSTLLLEITVDPQFQVIVLDNDNVPQYKVRGRLINFNDGSAISQRTLFVHLHYKSDDEMKPAAEIPVFVMLKTDSTGYFSFDAPGQPLHRGFVKIAGLPDDIFGLEMDATNGEQLDKNQIIVIDGDILPVEDHEDDCSCHGDPDSSQMPDAEDLVVSGAYSNLKGKNCVDFTKPNRSLEEFSYVKIVRTTEPDFKKVPYRKPPLLKVPGGSNFNHIQSHENVSYEPEGGTATAKKNNGNVDTQQNDTDGNDNETQQDTPKEPDLRAFYLHIQNSWAANQKWWIFIDRPFELINTDLLMFTPAPDSYDDYNPIVEWKNTLAQLFEYVYEKTHKTDSELYAFLQFINNRFKAENKRRSGNPEEMEDFVLTFFQEGSHGRIDVDGNHGIDWDDSPTLYQNTSIAHGHIIHIKQIWRADGYSMGDLLYSLPLAPCQKKQIAIFDWGRSESAGRTESLTAEDHLTAHLSRDRDVTDIINTSLSESIKGGSESELYSKSKTSGFGGGFGGAFGGSLSGSMPPEATAAATGVPANVSGSASLGVSGGLAGGVGKFEGTSNSSASAWQDSARNLSASSMNNLKDSIMQSASSIRSQRSTVIETISQNETMNVQTEVIANHNHCHSMTMEYFEVLRHFAIEQKVADVQECLFIPLEMTAFSAEKILRWKDELYRALPAQGLKEGIIALEDIKRKYKFADPNEILADEAVQEIYGEIIISLNINRPKDPEPVLLEEGLTSEFYGFDEQEWQHLLPFLGAWNTSKIKSAFEREVQKRRDEIWSREILPEILANFLDQLEIDAYDSNNKPLNLDLEMAVEPNTRMKYSRLKGKRALKKSRKIAILKDYNPGHELKLILRMFPGEANVSRSKIHDIQIKNNFDLPEGSKAVFFGGFMRYKTNSLNETLFSISKRHDEFTEDGSSIFTPLNQRELFNPVKEAYKTANRLIEHINDHLEHYHKVIWYQMDSDKRYMMLDGFTAPNADGRSVASVIENRLIDIVGNNLVMPVAKGVRIDPTFKQLVEGESESEETTKPIDLLKHYSPNTPIPPFRVSVPTRGVYAEAVMGNCNSCEKIDESRHWRFTEVPCGDEPTAIGTISTDSRRAAPSDLTAKDLSTPIINIQNAPDAPDPQGFAGALEALTASNAFNNLTGLDQTQLNALEALKAASTSSSAAMQGSMDSAQAYAQMAKDLAMHASSIKNSAKTADAIDNAAKAGKISDEDAKKLHLENLKSRIPSLVKNSADLPQRDPNSLLNSDEMKHAIQNAASSSGSQIEYSDPDEGTLKIHTGKGYGLSADEYEEYDLGDLGTSPIQPLRIGDKDKKNGVVTYNGSTFNAREGQLYTQVQYLQNNLIEIGLGEIVGAPDGDYGGRTALAVVIFQGFASVQEKNEGPVESPLRFEDSVDGNAGSSTRGALRRYVEEDRLSLNVKELKKTLAILGFGDLLDNRDDNYDWSTYFAVREFQSYASMDFLNESPTIGGEETLPTGTLADHYSVVSNPKKYTGPINGSFDAVMDDIAQTWLENFYRCPVIVESWELDNNYQPTTIHKQGIWKHDTMTSTNKGIFVSDKSDYYNIPNSHNQNGRVVIGKYARYSGWGGPQTLPARNQVWSPDSEITPDNFVGNSWNQLNNEQQSTFRVVRSISELETFGYYDAMNAYDRAVLSSGPYHWTICLMNNNGSYSNGELMAFLAYLRSENETVYNQYVGNFGVRPSKEWSENGDSHFVSSLCNYSDWIKLQVNANTYVNAPKNDTALGHYFRSWHWYYRIQMMMRASSEAQRLMWDFSRLRIRDILETPWDGVTQVSNGQGGTKLARIGDYFTSEKAVAFITRWHVRFPANMAGSRAGSYLTAALQAANLNGDPSTWGDQEEADLLAALRSQGVNKGFDLDVHYDYLYDWPSTAHVNIGLTLNTTGNTQTGNLLGTRNSFNLDSSDLPTRPF